MYNLAAHHRASHNPAARWCAICPENMYVDPTLARYRYYRPDCVTFGQRLAQLTLLSDWIGCEEGYPYRRRTQQSTFVIFYCRGALLWTDDVTVRDIFYLQVINWISLAFRARISTDLPRFFFFENWGQLANRIAKYVDADNFSVSVLLYCHYWYQILWGHGPLQTKWLGTFLIFLCLMFLFPNFGITLNKYNCKHIKTWNEISPPCPKLTEVYTWLVIHPTLQWRHNEREGVSNHQPHDYLLNRLFRHRSKETPKLRVTGLCEGNSPVTGEFLTQRASSAENVSIWWRHHEQKTTKHSTVFSVITSHRTLWHEISYAC